MSFQQELRSWISPTQLDLAPIPQVGDKAPSTDALAIPAAVGKPTIVAFLRHCGCPFAERTFLVLRNLARDNPSIHCVAVSHSNQESTDKWLNAIEGQDDIQVIVDDERKLYAKWGLGVSNWLHLANPAAFWSAYTLGRDEGIKIRPTESGYRWQTAGTYAVDAEGIVRWGGPAGKSDEEVDFEEAVSALRSKDSKL